MGNSGSDEAGISRREALKKGLMVGGTVLWVAPVVQTIGMTDAFAQAPSGPHRPIPQGSGGSTSGSPKVDAPGAYRPAPLPGSLESAPAGSGLAATGGQMTSGPTSASIDATRLAAPSASGSLLARTGQDTKRLVELGGAATIAGIGMAALAHERRRTTSEPEEPPAE